MAIVGHFANLSEAQKLVQSTLLAGIIQEVFEEGQLLSKLPVTTIDSKSIKYNREKTLPSAAQYGIHAQIPWNADVEYESQVETELKRTVRQDVLDKFIEKTYKTPNDYRAVVLKQLRKGCMRTIEDLIIYGDDTGENTKGLDKFCPAGAGHAFGDDQDYDMGGATHGLSIEVLLELIDQCKPKPDALLMTRAVRNKITEFSWGKSGAIVYAATLDQLGRRVESIDSVPVIISDFLTTENDNVGGKLGSGNLVSVYAIRFADIEDGGLTLVTGGDTGGVDFFNVTELDNLEDYDASGIRLVAYWNLALGSTKAIARVHSIDQTKAVV